MRRAALFYNPLSGLQRDRRAAVVESVAGVLRSAGVEVSPAETTGAAGTPRQVRDAICSGCDTILACGGDGTIHDIVQGMAGSDAALGVIPAGTANTLAHDLRLPLAAVPAARALLKAEPKRIAIGQVSYNDFAGNSCSRYFIVTVGIGVDAHLFYKLNPLVKSRLGMAAYYWKATHLWMTYPLEWFEVTTTPDATGDTIKVSQLLAVRIRDFGGVLRELAPGAALERNDFRLVLFRTRSRLAYLQYILRGMFGRGWSVNGIELTYSEAAWCRGIAGERGKHSRIFVEADGELVGTLPADIRIVPDALSLLMP